MKYVLENEYLKATFDSQGGEIISLKNLEGEELLWQKNPEVWNGTSPNLFPYIGRLYEGYYTFKGEKYELKSHGFLRNNELRLLRKTKNSISFVFSDTEETLKRYPFNFRIKVTFSLVGNKVKVRYSILNTGRKTMYFGIGGHTGFNTDDFEKWKITFLDNKDLTRVYLSDDFFVSEKKEIYNNNHREWLLKHEFFYKDAVILENPPHRLRLEKNDGSRIIDVDYSGFNYVGIWQKINSQFLCVEPWSSLPGRQGVIEDIEKQDNLISLKGHGYYSVGYEIKVVR